MDDRNFTDIFFRMDVDALNLINESVNKQKSFKSDTKQMVIQFKSFGIYINNYSIESTTPKLYSIIKGNLLKSHNFEEQLSFPENSKQSAFKVDIEMLSKILKDIIEINGTLAATHDNPDSFDFVWSQMEAIENENSDSNLQIYNCNSEYKIPVEVFADFEIEYQKIRYVIQRNMKQNVDQIKLTEFGYRILDTQLKGFKKEDMQKLISISKMKKEGNNQIKFSVESNQSKRAIEIDGICENSEDQTEIDVFVKLKDLSQVISVLQSQDDKGNKLNLMIQEDLLMFKVDNGMVLNFLICFSQDN